ncbi:fibrocystin-L-like [Branchiostoma lanceolatum]|uniref:fibrocystin-L-like n=1 Tax=Branchiostoma lanceolatum TaxID=7740 RepID=UPI003456D1E1
MEPDPEVRKIQGPVILEDKTGGKLDVCNLLNPSTKKPYGVVLDGDSATHGSMTCRVDHSYIGNLNASYVVSDLGRSRIEDSALQTSASGERYLIQSHAEILAVTPSKGSTAGGTLVTIQGRYFMENASVAIEGVPCDVLSVSPVEITCRTRAQPFGTRRKHLYPGNRGLLYEVWTKTFTADVHDVTKFSATSGDYQSFFAREAANPPKAVTGDWDRYSFRLSGFFVPPVTADYTFWIYSDDQSVLYLSNSDRRENKVEIAECPSYTSSYFTHRSQKSAKLPLVGNQQYYMEAVVHDYGGPDYISVGVQIHSPQFCTADSNKMEEKQVISIQQDVKNEVQTIVIQMAEGSDGPVEFSLLWDGVRSKPIPITATAKQVSKNCYMRVHLCVNACVIQEAVEAMLTVQCVQPEPSDVLFHRDYETVHGTVWGTLSRDTEPYCGRASLRLPAHLFGHGRVKMHADGEGIYMFDVEVYPAVCLAYKGRVARNLAVQLRYHNKFVDDVRTAWRHYPVFSELADDEIWQYTCTDLRNLTREDKFFVDRKKQGTKLYVLWIHLGVISGQQAYIDEFSIAASPVFVTQVNDTVPARPGGNIITDFNVTQTEPDVYTLTFNPTGCAGAIPLIAMADMTATAGDVTADSNVVVYADSVEGPTWMIMVMRRTRATRGVGGYFNMGYNGRNVTVSAQVSAYDLQTLLLDTYPELQAYSLRVDKHGDCVSPEWTLTFSGGPCDAPDFQVSNVSLTGDDPEVINYIIDGGVILSPIPGDMLATPHSEPQVTVIVNDVPSTCHYGNCTFHYTTVSMATVTAVSPSSGSAGQAIEITGSRFPNNLGNINVTVGDVTCDVISITTTNVKCIVGLMTSGGVHRVVVYVHPHGYALNTQGPVTFTYDVNITRVQPTKGSTAGGTLLTLHGTGINNATVRIGNEHCTSISVSNPEPTKIQCRTPALMDNAGALANVTVEVCGVSAMLEDAFTYDPAITPVISGTMPANVSLSGGDILQLEGSLFGSNDSLITVTVGSSTCEIMELVTDNNISCILPPLPQGRYPVLLHVDDIGYAYNSAPLVVEYVFRLDSIDPMEGSLAGGTELHISGEGFSTNSSAIDVKVGPVSCDVQEISKNTLVCVTRPYSRRYHVKNAGILNYTYSDSKTPVVTNVSPLVGAAGSEVVLEGKHFSTTARDNRVRIGQYSCNVTTASESKIVCIISDQESLPTGSILPVSLKVRNSGNAILWEKNSMFSIVPIITSLTPSSGSVAGGTTVSIFGTGFHKAGYETKVMIGGELQCEITELSYVNIICRTVSITSRGNVSGTTPYTTLFTRVQNRSDTTPVSTAGIALSSNVTPVPMVGNTSSTTRDPVSVNPMSTEDGSISEMTVTSFMETTDELYMTEVTSVGTETNHIEPISTNTTLDGNLTTDSVTTVTANAGVVGNSKTESSYQNMTMSATKVLDSQPITLPATTMMSITSPYSPENMSILGLTTVSSSTMATMPNSTVEGPPYWRTEVTVVGSKFPDDMTSVTITVGNHPCSIRSFSKHVVICWITNATAGHHTVTLDVNQKGFAIFNTTNSVRIFPIVTKITPNQGSLAGGTEIVVTGQGFDVAGNTTVSFGQKPCSVISVDHTEIRCITPPGSGEAAGVVTVNKLESESFTFLYSQDKTPIVHSVHPSIGTHDDNLTISGENFSNMTSDVRVLVGGKNCSVVVSNDTVITCTSGVRLAGVYQVQLSVTGLGDALSNATFEVQLQVTGISETEGSFGGHQLIVISGSGFHPNNTSITLCGEPCNVVNESSQQISCLTPSRCNDRNDVEETCTVVLTVPGVNATEAPSSYTYRTNSTPKVTSLSPQMGEEGTVITMYGHGFRDGQNTVHIGDAVCNISSENSTTLQCELGYSAASGSVGVVVTVGNLGRACTNPDVVFHYVHRWSSPRTWPDGAEPQDGDTVTIGPGLSVLLDTNTTVLKLLHINGGELIFDQKDLELHAEAVLITGGGSLQIGTAELPFLHTAHIVLYGDSSGEGLPLYGAKTIVVREGTVDMYGMPVSPSWTRLNETALRGNTNMTLREPVNWTPGSTVVVTATGDWNTGDQHEEVKVTEVSPDGLTLSFTPALRFTHTATEGELAGWTFGVSAMVFPINRNIVFRGHVKKERREQHDVCVVEEDLQHAGSDTCFLERYRQTLGKREYGAQVVVHADNPSASQVNVHIQDVEFTNVGKAYSLGNHPITFSMCGDVSGSFVRSSVIRQSFNRGVGVQGTDNLSLKDNVLYDVKGNGFFTQDGDEKDNIFENNLAVMIKQSVSLQAEDLMPSGFLLRHPGNLLEGNVVVGSEHGGFWYNLPARTGGTARTSLVCPRKVPLATFQGNAAYSCHGAGLLVSPSYRPNVGSNCGSSEDQLVTFANFTASGCFRGIHMVSVGSVQVARATIIGSGYTGIEYTKTEGDPSTEVPLIRESVIVATRTPFNTGGPCTEVGIRAPQSKHMTLSDVTFVHFDIESCAALGGCAGCEKFQAGDDIKVERLKFYNSPNRVAFRWESECWFKDSDRSLSGKTHAIVLPWTPILPTESCKVVPAFSKGSVSGAVCDKSVVLHRCDFYNVKPGWLSGTNMSVSTEAGTLMVPFMKNGLRFQNGWATTLPRGQIYTVEFQTDILPINLSYKANFHNFQDGDFLVMRHVLASQPDKVLINKRLVERSYEPLTYAKHKNLQWHLVNNTLSYIVSGKGKKTPTDIQVSVEFYDCSEPTCGGTVYVSKRPRDAVFWSHDSSWRIGGSVRNGQTKVPQEGDDVDIPEGLWMVADVPLPRLGSLRIRGTLEVPIEHSNVINVSCIVIIGGRLVIGFEGEVVPRGQTITVALHGGCLLEDVLSSRAKRATGELENLVGIAVYGELDLHGSPHLVTWTHLSSTFAAGNNKIRVRDEVDWQPGDEIVVTSTSYDPHQAETFSIRKVGKDRRTLYLSNPLQHTHLGETLSLSDGSRSYTMAAEVGLLSRNLRVKVTSSDDKPPVHLYVGQLTEGSKTYRGSARISDVEFSGLSARGTNQRSFAMTFTGGSLIGQESASYVINSSVHHIQYGGLHALDSRALEIDNNVFYWTLGPTILIEGHGSAVSRNLVCLSVVPNTTEKVRNWYGAIDVTKADGVTLTGNTVAGSERIAFKTSGVSCGSSNSDIMEGNVGHSSLHGYRVPAGNGKRGCTKISKFTGFKNFDYGISFHTESSVVVEDVTLVDNGVAVLPMVYGPSALSHETANKFITIKESLLVGSSPLFNCVTDRSVTGVTEETVVFRSPKSPTNGRVGILWPFFTSSATDIPEIAWHVPTSYPAINGVMYIHNVTFANFGYRCAQNNLDVAIMTNPSNADVMHPVVAEGVRMIDVEKDSRLFLHRGTRSDCRGSSLPFIRDMDGGITGGQSTVIPDVDYRLTRYDDHLLPESIKDFLSAQNLGLRSVAPFRGIVRKLGSQPNCFKKDAWQAYNCTGIDHSMLVIESLDPDTQTRHVGPVAILENGYLNLVDGPTKQASGDCDASTCACTNRISNFYTIVATGHPVQVFFSASNPQDLRLHLLNTKEARGILLQMYYDRLERLDVYVQGEYITPTNGKLSSGQLYIKTQEKEDTFIPPLPPNKTGVNYFDRENQVFYVVVTGEQLVEVRTVPTVLIIMDVELEVVAVGDDEVRQKFADLLVVDVSRVRIISKTERNSRRRKRDLSGEVVTLQVEVADPPLPTIERYDVNAMTTAQTPSETTEESQAGEVSVTWEELQAAAARVVNSYQKGTISEELGLEVLTLSIADAIPPPEKIEFNTTTNATTSASENIGSSVIVNYPVPVSMEIYQGPPRDITVGRLPVQPILILLDINGERVTSVGHNSAPWYVTATAEGYTSSQDSPLQGAATISFVAGWANYTDLRISEPSNGFRIVFEITYPPGSCFSRRTETILVANEEGETVNWMWWIIGGSSGGGFLLVLLLVIIICVCKKKSARRVGSDVVVANWRKRPHGKGLKGKKFIDEDTPSSSMVGMSRDDGTEDNRVGTPIAKVPIVYEFMPPKPTSPTRQSSTSQNTDKVTQKEKSKDLTDHDAQHEIIELPRKYSQPDIQHISPPANKISHNQAAERLQGTQLSTNNASTSSVSREPFSLFKSLKRTHSLKPRLGFRRNARRSAKKGGPCVKTPAEEVIEEAGEGEVEVDNSDLEFV